MLTSYLNSITQATSPDLNQFIKSVMKKLTVLGLFLNMSRDHGEHDVLDSSRGRWMVLFSSTDGMGFKIVPSSSYFVCNPSKSSPPVTGHSLTPLETETVTFVSMPCKEYRMKVQVIIIQFLETRGRRGSLWCD